MISLLRETSRSLAFRIAVLLALALLPIGIIALAQTLQMMEQSEQRAEAAMLALTGRAAVGEEGLIRIGLGSAQSIARIMPTLRSDPAACDDALREIVTGSDALTLVGYVDATGIVACASDGTGTDLSETPLYRRMVDDPRTYAVRVENAPISRTTVIVMGVPVLVDERFDGYVILSIAHWRLIASRERLDEMKPLDLILFNTSGEVLTSEAGNGVTALDRLPRGASLYTFAGERPRSFKGETRGGQRRFFTVVPIVPNLIYALGVWERGRSGLMPGMLSLAMPLMFPILMWLACLGVAYLAVERMVIGPTRNLRARMLLFMRSRQISPPKGGSSVPSEIREMDETWEMMASSILRDEAELEDTIHDKNVLLKEVHHRVKNNLQLIASILNMTIRKTREPGTKDTLKDVQNRVMSLATVHQNLYETSTEGRVRADELLEDIVKRITLTGLQRGEAVKVTTKFEPKVLYPDQAVPLALLASEAVTNALKYLGRPRDGDPWLSVELTDLQDEGARLTIANSTGEALTPEPRTPGIGLGEQLINAFVQQLEGVLDVINKDGVYEVRLWLPHLKSSAAGLNVDSRF